ncbi:hypothetical protein Barb6_00053 [Bacteroidales bacterium Barb6]|nr:hypothetical protein Barb6_00053 [Bacteroidales bacterium Barb6]OAV74081.1 hypothetical protein Barb7_02465 [Bacteroidales bacterium Barb7]
MTGNTAGSASALTVSASCANTPAAKPENITDSTNLLYIQLF